VREKSVYKRRAVAVIDRKQRARLYLVVLFHVTNTS